MIGGFLFFRYLQNEKPDLLDFRAVGDKWQIVHGWLRDRVKRRHQEIRPQPHHQWLDVATGRRRPKCMGSKVQGRHRLAYQRPRRDRELLCRRIQHCPIANSLRRLLEAVGLHRRPKDVSVPTLNEIASKARRIAANFAEPPEPTAELGERIMRRRFRTQAEWPSIADC